MAKKMRWHVVVNADNLVLAVYGAALYDEAVAQMRAIMESTGGSAFVRTVTGVRPSVYGTVKVTAE